MSAVSATPTHAMLAVDWMINAQGTAPALHRVLWAGDASASRGGQAKSATLTSPCLSGVVLEGNCCETGIVSSLSGVCAALTARCWTRRATAAPPAYSTAAGCVAALVWASMCTGLAATAAWTPQGSAASTPLSTNAVSARAREGHATSKGIVTVAAESQRALNKSIQVVLLPEMSNVLSRFGLAKEDLSVSEVRFVNPEAHVADVSFHAKAAEQAGRLGFPQLVRVQELLSSLQNLQHPNITNLYGLTRKGHCGNGICELGERPVIGERDTDDCPKDCPIPVRTCPAGREGRQPWQRPGLVHGHIRRLRLLAGLHRSRL